MLQAFIDESGRGNGDLFVFAGYIAPARTWADSFVPQWQDMLDLGPPNHRRLNVFKMQEMLDDPERSSWFYRVIEKCVSAEVSCVLSASELYSAYREFPWPLRLVDTDLFTNPYYYGFKAIMSLLAQYQRELGLNEPIDFIFDEAREKNKCLLAWDGMKLYSSPEVRNMLGDTPIFRNDERVFPLQAADLLAYWAREWSYQGVLGDLDKMEFPWERRRKIPGAAFRMTKDTFLNEFRAVCKPESLDRIFREADGKVRHSTRVGSTMSNGLRITNKDNHRPVYSNNVATSFTQFDIRVQFAEIVPNGNGGADNELRASVVLTPAHAKAVANLLAATVANYESQFGRVEHPNPPGKSESKTA